MDEYDKMQIGASILELDAKNRIERKIKFLLDVRGQVIVNKLDGAYVEWGVYQGEMIYAAHRVLQEHIHQYVGLDTFEGLPEPKGNDNEIYHFGSPGDHNISVESVEKDLSEVKPHLIVGDFRDQKVIDEFNGVVDKVAIAVLDCNWPSSLKAAFEATEPKLYPGSIIYIDDYFAGTRHENLNENLLKQSKLEFDNFMTYPPFGRAFIVKA